MALEDDIAKYLRSFPGTKARDMAAALHAERSEINSILYRSQSNRFRVDAEYRWSLTHDATSTTESVPMPPPPTIDVAPTRAEVLKARRTLAGLKRGVPPIEAIESLAIGMKRIKQQVDRLLSEPAQPRWFAVTGEYGEGKSFFRAFACQNAMDAGFAVASLVVNKDEGALQHPQRHLSVIFQSLQSPLETFVGQQGLAAIFRHWLTHAEAHDIQEILGTLCNIKPAIPAGQDPAYFEIMVDGQLSSATGCTHTVRSAGRIRQTIIDDKGFMYRQFGAKGVVYRVVNGHTDWRYYGEGDTWNRLGGLQLQTQFEEGK